MLKNKKMLASGGLVTIAIGAYLAFGFFGVHKAFVDDTVAESGPVFASGAQTESTPTAPPKLASNETPSTQTPSTQTPSAQTPTTQAAPPEETTSETPTAPVPDAQAEETPIVLTSHSGTFSGKKNYSVEGTASILTDGKQTFLRLSEFASSNGPDLKVYLRSEDGSFVNLGPIKGNKGDQNYELTGDIDLGVYNKVEIWCERFSVGFGSAPLTAS